VTAIHCKALQHTTTHCSTLHRTQQHTQGRVGARQGCGPLVYCVVTAPHCNTLQRSATHCITLQHTATYCSTLQTTATHCNTVQSRVRRRRNKSVVSTLQHKKSVHETKKWLRHSIVSTKHRETDRQLLQRVVCLSCFVITHISSYVAGTRGGKPGKKKKKCDTKSNIVGPVSTQEASSSGNSCNRKQAKMAHTVGLFSKRDDEGMVMHRKASILIKHVVSKCKRTTKLSGICNATHVKMPC